MNVTGYKTKMAAMPIHFLMPVNIFTDLRKQKMKHRLHYNGCMGRPVARLVACPLRKQGSHDQSSCPAHYSFVEK